MTQIAEHDDGGQLLEVETQEPESDYEKQFSALKDAKPGEGGEEETGEALNLSEETGEDYESALEENRNLRAQVENLNQQLRSVRDSRQTATAQVDPVEQQIQNYLTNAARQYDNGEISAEELQQARNQANQYRNQVQQQRQQYATWHNEIAQVGSTLVRKIAPELSKGVSKEIQETMDYFSLNGHPCGQLLGHLLYNAFVESGMHPKRLSGKEKEVVRGLGISGKKYRQIRQHVG